MKTPREELIEFIHEVNQIGIRESTDISVVIKVPWIRYDFVKFDYNDKSIIINAPHSSEVNAEITVWENGRREYKVLTSHDYTPSYNLVAFIPKKLEVIDSYVDAVNMTDTRRMWLAPCKAFKIKTSGEARVGLWFGTAIYRVSAIVYMLLASDVVDVKRFDDPAMLERYLSMYMPRAIEEYLWGHLIRWKVRAWRHHFKKIGFGRVYIYEDDRDVPKTVTVRVYKCRKCGETLLGVGHAIVHWHRKHAATKNEDNINEEFNEY